VADSIGTDLAAALSEDLAAEMCKFKNMCRFGSNINYQ